MEKIIRRILSIIPAVLLQLVWLIILSGWLAPWAAVLEFILSLLAVLFVLYLITKQDEGTYKILWLLVLLTFPIPGAILYALFGDKRTTKPLQKKLNAAAALHPVPSNELSLALEALERENRRMSQTFRDIQAMTGFPVHYCREAVYYPLGDQIFPAMLEALKQAEQFIFVEYFIVENGFMWDSMVEIMARKAAKGMDVRVMYDDVGSLSTHSRENARELQAKGIRCIAFNPLIFVKGTVNYRDHRKMLIIDGRTVFSGGINLADEYINRVEKHGHWKDTGFRLTGEAVENYTRMFTEFWNAFANDPLSNILPDPAPKATLDPMPETTSELTDGYILSYYDSPLRPQAASNELYIDLLSQAKDYAWFFTPYLMPGDALLDAFSRAARRGVDVRIIMPGVPDKKLVFRMSHSYYGVLLKAGVKIYEYTPGFVHAKACLVDGIVGTVGTVNLDYRSLFLHFENNSLFYGASLLADLKEDFISTQRQCREITVNDIPTSFRHWMMDGVLRIIAPLC